MARRDPWDGMNRPLLESLEQRLLLSAGELETSFGDGGVVLTDIYLPGAEVRASDVIVQDDGKIIVAATAESGYEDFLLQRYNPDGSLDTGFGLGGQATTDFRDVLGYASSPDNITALAIDSIGRIVAFGKASGMFGLARYNTNGTLDETFGTGGKVVTHFDDLVRYYRLLQKSVIIDQYDRVIIGGVVDGRTDEDIAVACYTPDGQLDPTFGTAGGRTVIDLSESDQREDRSNDYLAEALLGIDGRILLVGYTYTTTHWSPIMVMGLTPEGQLDVGFGTDGMTALDFAHTTADSLLATLKPNG
ncbi:MAG: delta-60 repeat domain-containing protein, partial [Planctomycetota bacterium]